MLQANALLSTTAQTFESDFRKEGSFEKGETFLMTKRALFETTQVRSLEYLVVRIYLLV